MDAIESSIDLKSMGLEVIAAEEFFRLKDKVAASAGALADVFARIRTPLRFSSYEEAILEFFKHENAYRLSVFNKDKKPKPGWEQLPVKYVYAGDEERLAKLYGHIARTDKMKHEKPYFELKFGLDYTYHANDLIRVNFKEFGNEIIGYEMRFPYFLSQWLEFSEFMRDFEWCRALWAPE
ncbi:hypothetical protein KY311_05030 [Candidatus Woesearchaeota archaeon]|nr:hypothetical protein [Candidatus Woesearchaeota archaeon]